MGTRFVARYRVRLIAKDMALRGWNNSDLARATKRGVGTIHRFMSGETQTPKVASDIARALGHDIGRYLSGVKAA